MVPRLMWLSRLGIILQTGRLPVQFPVRAQAWAGACKRQTIDVSLTHQRFSPSLSPSLPFSLKKINK